jgi:hypothetical protein
VFQSTATTFLYLLAFKGELFYISAGLSVLSSSTFSWSHQIVNQWLVPLFPGDVTEHKFEPKNPYESPPPKLRGFPVVNYCKFCFVCVVKCLRRGSFTREACSCSKVLTLCSQASTGEEKEKFKQKQDVRTKITDGVLYSYMICFYLFFSHPSSNCVVLQELELMRDTELSSLQITLSGKHLF